MSDKVLWKSLKPRFNTMTPEDSKPENIGTFHKHLADSLSEWFNSYFIPKQKFSANGIQYIPPVEEVTWAEPTNPLKYFMFVNQSMFFTRAEVLMAFKVPAMCWQNLFSLIGMRISTTLNSVICTIPGSAVAGAVTVPYMTAHYRMQAFKFLADIKKLDYTEENIKSGEITKQIWDKFEDNLVNAINNTPPTIIMVGGALPPGTFTGTINAKLSI